MIGGPAGGIIGVLSALPGIIEAVGIAIESPTEKMEKLKTAAQEASSAFSIKNKEANELEDYIK
jgi:hypothetical protein